MLSPFFVRLAKLAPGAEAPVEFNVAVLVFVQMIGLTMHAGIVKLV